MKIDPGDDEVGELGLEDIFARIIPGSDLDPNVSSSSNEAEPTSTGIDDPLGW